MSMMKGGVYIIIIRNSLILVQSFEINAGHLLALHPYGRDALHNKQGISTKHCLTFFWARRKGRNVTCTPEALRNSHNQQGWTNFVSQARLRKLELGCSGEKSGHAQLCAFFHQTDGLPDAHTTVEHATLVMNRVDEEVHVHNDLHYRFQHVRSILADCAVQSSVEGFTLEKMDWPLATPFREVGVDEVMIIQSWNILRELEWPKKDLRGIAFLIRGCNGGRPSNLSQLESVRQGHIRWIDRDAIRFQSTVSKDSPDSNHSPTRVHSNRCLRVHTNAEVIHEIIMPLRHHLLQCQMTRSIDLPVHRDFIILVTGPVVLHESVHRARK
mmetsp:Transcript_48472/g.113552  ORF Transcript_48472/g.113552 Transcript_48472/m.113552 type:complete len:327 (+) Transcript_48472:126-1106(+)